MTQDPILLDLNESAIEPSTKAQMFTKYRGPMYYIHA